MEITTEGYSALQICDEIEWYLEDQLSESPTWREHYEE